jgi:DNA-binding transcriptional LysR family regulator
MVMDAISLDQFRVFATVAEAGSFSAAARRLNRAQSAITYAIQKLEEQVGVELFDRSAYRPVLSDAGRALLPRAQRVLEDVGEFKAQAVGIAGGLEPEVALVVDAMFPMERLVCAMADFKAQFPSVKTRILVESLGASVCAILGGDADIGVVTQFASVGDELVRAHAGEVELVAVAAPHHPLAAVEGPIGPEALRDEVQLVLTDRSEVTRGRDHGVMSNRTWRLADLGAKHAMLRAGLGWGSMPLHMVADDLADGRLVRMKVKAWGADTRPPTLEMVTARRRDFTPGPAGAWMLERLAREER